MQSRTLEEIVTRLEQIGRPFELTVRELLAAIGQRRRGRKVMHLLRSRMRKARLKTDPAFWGVPLDTSVAVYLETQFSQDAVKLSPAYSPSILLSENLQDDFTTLMQGLQAESDRLSDLGANAFKQADYSLAKASAHKAEQIAGIIARAKALAQEWSLLSDIPAAPQPKFNPTSTGTRRSFGKLTRGSRTPESEFVIPILETLVEMGGHGQVNQILETVRTKMAKVLKLVDFKPLPAGNKSKSIRWWNSAQWARFNLKKNGYLKANSPHGVWEITDEGRAHLIELKK